MFRSRYPEDLIVIAKVIGDKMETYGLVTYVTS